MSLSRNVMQGGTTMSNQAFTALKAQIEQETDHDLKELYSMMYGSLVYTEYVKEINPELHKRAVEYLCDTHGLKGVSFE
mgnify:FL=1